MRESGQEERQTRQDHRPGNEEQRVAEKAVRVGEVRQDVQGELSGTDTLLKPVQREGVDGVVVERERRDHEQDFENDHAVQQPTDARGPPSTVESTISVMGAS